MAKDTEKLIRQLSLISFLMAQGRPVSALEIKREVEGYSDMNDDAFARRFYADRAELESLGISLQVEKPGEGFFEAELYALPPENYYLPAIQFSDAELAALPAALQSLDGKFAYAEPLRLALQQVSWGRRSRLDAGKGASVELGMTASAGGKDLSQRLSKIETAISRRKTVEFTYYTMQRDEETKRKVDPYHLVFRGGEFYLIGHSHERKAVRVFRLSRIRGKVSYASKAEHDFSPPEDFDRRDYATRAEWQLGDIEGSAKIFVKERIAWLVERDFGSYGEIRKVTKEDGAPGRGAIFETDFASRRLLTAWVLGWRKHAEVLEPKELAEEIAERRAVLNDRHSGEFKAAETVDRPLRSSARQDARSNGRNETPIRPERFARLVTLAGFLIDAARQGKRLSVAELCDDLKLDEEELREDIDVLNVVNFGGGTYVLYAEVVGDEIEVDSEPYGDSFAQPARLLPLEAKALVAAIDLLGDHLREGGLQSARTKIVEALGHDPSEEGLQIATGGDDSEVARTVNDAIRMSRVLELDYYKENEDKFTKREIEPDRLQKGKEGWYVVCWDRDRSAVRHFKLDRVREARVSDRSFERRAEMEEAAGVEEWLTDGEVAGASVARVWVSPDQARWERERRTVVEELADGAVVVEVPYAGTPWLIREVLKGAGDLVVLEPDDARSAIAKEVS